MSRNVPRLCALLAKLREEVKPMDSFGAAMHSLEALQDFAAGLEEELAEANRRLSEAQRRIVELEHEIAGDNAFARAVAEALNTGDGSYKP